MPAAKPNAGLRGGRSENADLFVGDAYDSIASNLARLPRFDDTIDADLSGSDHRLGSAPRGRKPKQFEKDVQLDEFPVELESARHGYLPGGWLVSAVPDVSRDNTVCACSAAFRPKLVKYPPSTWVRSPLLCKRCVAAITAASAVL